MAVWTRSIAFLSAWPLFGHPERGFGSLQRGGFCGSWDVNAFACLLGGWGGGTEGRDQGPAFSKVTSEAILQPGKSLDA